MAFLPPPMKKDANGNIIYPLEIDYEALRDKVKNQNRYIYFVFVMLVIIAWSFGILYLM